MMITLAAPVVGRRQRLVTIGIRKQPIFCTTENLLCLPYRIPHLVMPIAATPSSGLIADMIFHQIIVLSAV